MKALLLLCVLGFSPIYIWSQGTITSICSGNWNNATTWNPPTIPSATNQVIISSGHTVQIETSGLCSGININSGSKLSCNSTSSLTVKGNWSNSGVFTAKQSTIFFNGTVPQFIGGDSVSTFYNLVNTNATNVLMNKPVNIKNRLSLNSGTFNTQNNKLTFLSDSLITASLEPLGNGADIIGNITMQRYISSSTSGWRFLGSPVKTTLADWGNDFLTSGFPGSTFPSYNFCSIYRYDENVGGTSEYGYVMPSNITDSIFPGVGYWCWIGSSPSVVEVTGVPKKSTHTFNVSLTPNAGKNHDGWNMVANPYPSAIDWDSPGWVKTGIQDAIYIWDPTLQQYSTYLNNISINGGSNILPSSQAFWVEAIQNAPVLSCDESVKTSLDKTYAKYNAAAIVSVKIILTGNGYTDETAVCFSKSNSQNAEIKAVKLFSDNVLVPNICSVSGSLNLVVNSFPMSSSEIIVPIKVKVGLSGVYAIKNDAALSLPLNSCVFLEDLLTGTYTDLKSFSTYSFFISDTTTAPRFLLHISEPLIKNSIDATCSYKKNGMAIGQIDNAGLFNYTWKDGLGNILMEHSKVLGPDTLKNLTPGNYFVTASAKNKYCPSVTEEIVVKGTPAIAVNEIITDNKCPGNLKGAVDAVNISGGNSPYQYMWSNAATGAVVQNLGSGTYTLTLTDSKGCKDTSLYLIKDMSSIAAAFKIESDTSLVYVNQPVSFTNKSMGYLSSTWTFDNEVKTDDHLTHEFLSPGIYTVMLTVHDKSCSAETMQVVKVREEKKMVEPAIEIFNSEDGIAVTFNLDKPERATVYVYSEDGKTISSNHYYSYKNSENVKLGDCHGMYIVRVVAETAAFSYKLIK